MILPQTSYPHSGFMFLSFGYTPLVPNIGTHQSRSLPYLFRFRPRLSSLFCPVCIVYLSLFPCLFFSASFSVIYLVISGIIGASTITTVRTCNAQDSDPSTHSSAHPETNCTLRHAFFYYSILRCEVIPIFDCIIGHDIMTGIFPVLYSERYQSVSVFEYML